MENFPIAGLLVGLLFLLAGAEGLVRGASSLARRFGIPPLVIGLTVVAFGTSAPELAVSFKGALSGQGAVALGNIVGSNLFNTFLILGGSALIAPLVVAQQLVRREVPLMIVASVAVLLMGLDGDVGRVDGAILFGAFVGYTGYVLRASRKSEPEVEEEYDEEFGEGDGPPAGMVLSSVLVVGGLAFLILGSNWFVDGATSIARSLGVSELVIGLTVVAAGTSMPELVTSLMAVVRGERDIAVGNVVGSNIFNILAILGITGLLSPEAIPVDPAALRLDFPILIASAVACLPVFFSGHRIDRWEGAIFVALYVAYIFYLFLTATAHATHDEFRTTMLLFVLPLCSITILVILVRSLRAGALTTD